MTWPSKDGIRRVGEVGRAQNVEDMEGVVDVADGQAAHTTMIRASHRLRGTMCMLALGHAGALPVATCGRGSTGIPASEDDAYAE